jgi:hypothetical protein
MQHPDARCPRPCPIPIPASIRCPPDLRSRWLQLPLYLGLIVAQGVYVFLF